MTGYRAVVVGASAGGLAALGTLLSRLPVDFPLPTMVVQHVAPHSGPRYVQALASSCAVTVREAEEKEFILPGVVYVAPPDHHLLVEDDHSLSLTVDERVSFARPSIDVLFESAAYVFEESLIGVVLTGANSDGTTGLRAIRARGGLAIVQDPDDAESPEMPRSAIEHAGADHVLKLAEIGTLLRRLTGTGE